MRQALKDFQRTFAASRRARDATTRVPVSPGLEGPTILQEQEPRTERVEPPPAVREAIEQQSAPPSPQPVAAKGATKMYLPEEPKKRPVGDVGSVCSPAWR